ncbi:hypothetical protein [Streptomyces sp. SR-10]|uniref:hypothetical protein n=1 Tax=Streptomyces sp. SR-10 TaxID=3416442 RepID=UPI003CF3769A
MEREPQAAAKVLATRDVDEPDMSLGGEKSRRDVAALDKALGAVPPQTEEQFGPDPAETSCK